MAMASETNRPEDAFDESPDAFEGGSTPAPLPEPDELERAIDEDTRRWEAEAQAGGGDADDADDGDDFAEDVESDDFEPAGEAIVEDVAVTGTRRRAPVGVAGPYAPAAEVDDAPPRRRGTGCADLITAIFLLLTVLVISWLILLLANPQSPLNPLPPATLPALLVLASPEPSSTPTPSFTPEPPTPTVASPTPTVTPIPTSTSTPTATSTPVVGALTTAGAETPTPPPDSPFTPSPFPFTVKAIRYQPHDGPEGCNWMSLAGLVLGMDGQSRRREEGSLTVRVTSMDGLIDEVHYTGEPSPFPDSGFEAFLGPIPREGEYTVQLIGVMGRPLSDLVTVQTRAGCTENVAVVEFQQNRLY